MIYLDNVKVLEINQRFYSFSALENLLKFPSNCLSFNKRDFWHNGEITEYLRDADYNTTGTCPADLINPCSCHTSSVCISINSAERCRVETAN